MHRCPCGQLNHPHGHFYSHVTIGNKSALGAVLAYSHLGLRFSCCLQRKSARLHAELPPNERS